MKRFIQSCFGGVTIMGLISCWLAVASFVGAPEWLMLSLLSLLAAPYAVSLFLFPGTEDELILSGSAIWATLVYDVIAYSLLAYLLIELNDKDSDFRRTIRNTTLRLISSRFQR